MWKHLDAETAAQAGGSSTLAGTINQMNQKTAAKMHALNAHIVDLVARRDAHHAVAARRQRLWQRLHHVAQAACGCSADTGTIAMCRPAWSAIAAAAAHVSSHQQPRRVPNSLPASSGGARPTAPPPSPATRRTRLGPGCALGPHKDDIHGVGVVRLLRGLGSRWGHWFGGHRLGRRRRNRLRRRLRHRLRSGPGRRHAGEVKRARPHLRLRHRRRDRRAGRPERRGGRRRLHRRGGRLDHGWRRRGGNISGGRPGCRRHGRRGGCCRLGRQVHPKVLQQALLRAPPLLYLLQQLLVQLPHLIIAGHRGGRGRPRAVALQARPLAPRDARLAVRARLGAHQVQAGIASCAPSNAGEQEGRSNQSSVPAVGEQAAAAASGGGHQQAGCRNMHYSRAVKANRWKPVAGLREVPSGLSAQGAAG